MAQSAITQLAGGSPSTGSGHKQAAGSKQQTPWKRRSVGPASVPAKGSK